MIYNNTDSNIPDVASNGYVLFDFRKQNLIGELVLVLLDV